MSNDSIECEEGCGCRFRREDAYVLSVDGMDHFFCCSDCAEEYRNVQTTETAGVLRKYIRAGHAVADIGSGSGYYIPLLLELAGDGGRVYAIDRNQSSIEKIKSNHPSNIGHTLFAHVAEAYRLDFIPAGSVDFVLSNNVLCCTNRRNDAMREIHRILKDGGFAYIRSSTVYAEGIDPISESEWDSLFENFTVLDSGAGHSIRWRIGSRKQTDLLGEI